ncbi:MAG: hypothetical protein GYB26_06220 [Gammaproteobacteria bacterium]|uniref:Uncharacterized protein n=1 Tax=Marinobacter litoralis TaxID=187981 RepID=A0A3M2RKA3_9GAMM|nr:hypothetical protein [Marinobacter litoralis]MBR9870715.1 hypothetical protein [Gammaproteobacteria bacterium]RMJ05642.1 hypothetical protein DOQ08_00312 [Marinobacter litoralis]
MEMNKLKFGYRTLILTLGVLSFFPAMGALFLWVPLFERLSTNSGPNWWLFTGLMLIFLIQAVVNQVVVYFAVRPIAMKKLSIDKQEYWLMYLGQRYPNAWYR